MHKTPRTTIALMLLGAALAATAPAHADELMLDIDPKFRAKIAKEKVRAASKATAADRAGRSNQGLDSECGSQNIGNVDTGGRPGAAPREVFVFAPNAINFVGARGCN